MTPDLQEHFYWFLLTACIGEISITPIKLEFCKWDRTVTGHLYSNQLQPYRQPTLLCNIGTLTLNQSCFVSHVCQNCTSYVRRQPIPTSCTPRPIQETRFHRPVFCTRLHIALNIHIYTKRKQRGKKNAYQKNRKTPSTITTCMYEQGMIICENYFLFRNFYVVIHFNRYGGHSPNIYFICMSIE